MMKFDIKNTKRGASQDFSLPMPRGFQEFVGQDAVCRNLLVFIGASKQRRQALDHVLLFGPPGLGKTTLAHLITQELGVQFCATSGPAIGKAGDLAGILTSIEDNGVLFIDEVHRLNRQVEEILYSAMDRFVLDIIIGEGTGARSVKIPLPRFTLIGATTRLGLLTKPLRDRFGIQCRLDYYSPQHLQRIILHLAHELNISFTEDTSLQLAKYARGTPRIAIRLLKRVYDFATFNEKNENFLNDEISPQGEGGEEGDCEGDELFRGVKTNEKDGMGTDGKGSMQIDEKSGVKIGKKNEKKSKKNENFLNTRITGRMLSQVLRKLQIYDLGLDVLDISYLNCIEKKFNGGPVALNTIAGVVSETEDSLREIVEPYLLQQALVQKTNRGRVLTERGRIYLEQVHGGE